VVRVSENYHDEVRPTMDVSIEGEKVVVYDATGPHARQNLLFDQDVAKDKWYRYSGVYLYEECLKAGIQLITPDIYFALSKKPKAICVRDRCDIDMRVPLDLRRAGVKLALLMNSEQPLQACRFFWDLRRCTSYFDHSFIMKGVKDWVSPKSRFIPWFSPHAYHSRIREVPSDFRKKKFLTLMNSNQRIHWLRRLYVSMMNFIKPLPTFTNREQYKVRLEAIQYFSKYPDFDLYGIGWDKPVRYTHKYDEAIRRSYRGAPDDKFEVIKRYKFSLCFEAFLGGCVQEKIADCLYAGSVPVYWGAPDIAETIPDGCFIDFRKFGCDFARLDGYLRGMDEGTYDGYIKNINEFISSPAAYAVSQEKYVSDLIKLFESYF